MIVILIQVYSYLNIVISEKIKYPFVTNFILGRFILIFMENKNKCEMFIELI